MAPRLPWCAWLVIQTAICNAVPGLATVTVTRASLASEPPGVTMAELRKRLGPVITAISRQHNVSYSVGIRTAAGAITVTAGANDIAPSPDRHHHGNNASKMTAAGRFPMGSVTKSFTACQVMQAHERGRIDIDAPFAPYVDKILTRLNGTTLAQLWDGDPLVHNITARLLMGMRAGLHDYDDGAYAAWTYSHVGSDWTPFDILHALNKTWVCGRPGGCEAYASPGYVLLGLALCQIQNCSRYDQLDQMAVLPGKVRGKYKGLAFPENGPCSADPKIVHQYALKVDDSPGQGTVATHFDISKYSCLNGWACGNIAASVGDVAEWFWDIFHGEIVSPNSLKQMLNFVPLKKGWSPGLRYGLGMMHWEMGSRVDPDNLTWTFGHGGADWGSLARGCRGVQSHLQLQRGDGHQHGLWHELYGRV